MRPRSVAIVGASTREMSAGARIQKNLRLSKFKGPVYPINPRYEEVSGLKCYPTMASLPEVPDAVFIGIPAEQVAGVLEEAGALGVKAILCNASGFADGGPEGIERQKQMAAICARYGMPLCGPNNTGFFNLVDDAMICTWPRLPELKRGSVALITHSGSMAIAFGQAEHDIGLAYMVTAGNEAVTAAADYLDYIVRDPRVKVAALHLEAIRKSDLFASACAEAARRGVRVVVLKVGESEAARASIAAHTGSLAGDDRAMDAFLRKCGAVRVRDLDEFAETIRLFVEVPEAPRTKHVSAMTFSGGQAGLISDMAARMGLSVPQFRKETIDRLRVGFPPFGTPRNPIDAWGLGWDDDRFKAMIGAPVEDPDIAALAICVDLPEGGGADVFLFDSALQLITPHVGSGARIVFINNMTGAGFHKGLLEKLKAAGIPVLRGLQAGLLALKHWADQHKPAAPVAISEAVRAAGRAAAEAPSMADPERTALLQSAGVPMAACRRVSSREEAQKVAAELGFPVVLKGTAPSLPHKTELGLVKLGLADAAAVAKAYDEVAPKLAAAAKGQKAVCVVIQPMAGKGIELIVGVRNDLELGSVLAVGLGGTLVEVLDEVAVSVGPVDVAEAKAMLGRTKAAKLIGGVRGAGPFDMEAAAEAIAAISRFGAAARGTLDAIEVNPLIVLPKGAVGVDVVMAGKKA
jgi:acetate---CoA ligase (ADP-forming)